MFMRGLKVIFHFVLITPPRLRRWWTSVAEGPYSPNMLYGLAGKVLMPSVLLIAWLSEYVAVSERFLLAREFMFTSSWCWLYNPDDCIWKIAPIRPRG